MALRITPARSEPPLPSRELMVRIGTPPGSEAEVAESFVRMGLRQRECFEHLLGPTWTWDDTTLLDFGCGCGRLLRHFANQSNSTSLIGVDIDAPSIEWIRSNLPFVNQALVCGESPGIELADCAVDVVTAASVFTHLSTHSAGWLVELHRVLRPGGLLVASFLGAGSWAETYTQQPVMDEDRVGMRVLNRFQSWEHGGPTVFFSEWWIREHWGRAFEIVAVHPGSPFAPAGRNGHGWVVLRRREVQLTASELLAPRASEPREAAALFDTLQHLEPQIERAVPGSKTANDELATLRNQLAQAIAVAQRFEQEVNRLRRGAGPAS